MSGDPDTSTAGPASLIGNRDFLLFLVALLMNVMGTQIVIVAVGWQVYLKTGDPSDLGLVGLSQIAPALLLVAGMAAAVGTLPAVLVGGAATLGVTALWWWLFPEMRNIVRLDEVA